MELPPLKTKGFYATYMALDLPVLLLVLAVICTSFHAIRLLTATCALMLTTIIGLVLRKLNQKKYLRDARLKAEQWKQGNDAAVVYRAKSILPCLHTLLLPLFLSSFSFFRACRLAEVLLFGAMLCCILNVFKFDQKALMITAFAAMDGFSWKFGFTLDKGSIILTVLQGFIFSVLNGDIAKSLNFSNTVILSQLLTIAFYNIAGGYTYPVNGELSPFLDLSVNAGYLFLAFLLVLMAEELANEYPNNCIKYMTINLSRFFVLALAVFRFGKWVYKENGFRGGMTPLKSAFHLIKNYDALITLGICFGLAVGAMIILMVRSPAPDSAIVKRFSCKSSTVTALRKVLHFLVLACAGVAIYFKQKLLLALGLYCTFLLASAFELLRFYGFLPRVVERWLVNIYKTFGEAPGKRTLITSHVGFILACGAPLWISMFNKGTSDRVAAVLGLITVAFADSMAAIVGRHFKSLEAHGKSIEGSIAFFVSSLSGMLLAFFVTTHGQLVKQHIYVCMAVALGTTIAEAGSPYADNFIVAMTAGIVYNNAVKYFKL